jgi:hypothetical protein
MIYNVQYNYIILRLDKQIAAKSIITIHKNDLKHLFTARKNLQITSYSKVKAI